jgi:diguanylate cyclase (GGDEF)-like protein
MTHDPADERLIWLLTTMRHLFVLRDAERFITAATDAFMELAGAERAFFFLCEGDLHKLVPCCARGIGGLKIVAPEGRVASLAQQVLRDKQALLASDTAIEGTNRRLTESHARLVACAALMFEGQPMGVLYADGGAHKALAQTRHIELFCDMAAAGLDNARTFERASNDLLTGLPNNSSFMASLGRALREGPAGTTGGVVLLDLDAFRRINQVAGIDQGDKALTDIAHTLREVLCTDGIVARFGSDKFAVLLAPTASPTPIAVRLWDVAERARAALGTKIYHAVQLSTCIGAVGFEGHSKQSAQDVVAAADRVLAVARSRGEGQIEIGEAPKH